MIMKRLIMLVVAISMMTFLCSCSMEFEEEGLSDTSAGNTTTLAETSMADNGSKIEAFVEKYNQIAADKLVFVEDFTPSEKGGSHYRTEFRLNAFSEAKGKSYKIGEQTVDIVSYRDDMRIYAILDSLEGSIQMIQIASPLLDPKMNQDELNEVIEYVSEYKEANGKYYGNLGLTLFDKNKAAYYELMIKTD